MDMAAEGEAISRAAGISRAEAIIREGPVIQEEGHVITEEEPVITELHAVIMPAATEPGLR